MKVFDMMKKAEENAPKKNSEINTPEEIIMNQFKEGASEYWGEITNESITHNRTTGQGTEYYLVVASTKRDNTEGKLLQEWYISKKGEARVNPKRTMWISNKISKDISDKLDI